MRHIVVEIQARPRDWRWLWLRRKKQWKEFYRGPVTDLSSSPKDAG